MKLVDLGQVEHLRPDDHAEQELDDHDRDEQRRARPRCADSVACDRGRRDDRQERSGVDAQHGRVGRGVRAPVMLPDIV